MTTIIADSSPTQGVWIASDSRVVDDDGTKSLGQKLFAFPGGIVGVAGDFRANVAISRLCSQGYNLLTGLESGGLSDEFESLEDRYDSLGEFDLIIATPEGLFEFDSAERFVYPSAGPVAIGTGGHFALGAYEALKGNESSTEKRLASAVSIAGHFDIYTSGPVDRRFVGNPGVSQG